jgi:hypothetical protein
MDPVVRKKLEEWMRNKTLIFYASPSLAPRWQSLQARFSELGCEQLAGLQAGKYGLRCKKGRWAAIILATRNGFIFDRVIEDV